MLTEEDIDYYNIIEILDEIEYLESKILELQYLLNCYYLYCPELLKLIMEERKYIKLFN